MKAILFAFLLTTMAASAAVVQMAPDFTFAGANKKSLRGLRGQPVVLFLADSPNNKKFRKQLSRMKAIYQQFASRGVVFAAALGNEEQPVPSDIPVVITNNGPGVAAAYGMDGGYKLVIIGKDGNVDFESDRVVAGTRVREVIQNSFEIQKVIRREVPRKKVGR